MGSDRLHRAGSFHGWNVHVWIFRFHRDEEILTIEFVSLLYNTKASVLRNTNVATDDSSDLPDSW